jgi:hypothetical protein
MTRFRRYLYLYERFAAVLFLTAALLLPRVSAVLVEFIPGVDTIVICTGSEYVTITLGPDGSPLSTTESSDNRCTLSEVAALDLPEPAYWEQLSADHQVAFSVKENQRLATLRLTLKAPSRAPPVLI